MDKLLFFTFFLPLCFYFFYRQDAIGGGGNQRVVLGMFNVYPGFGFISAGSSQLITVDCVAETPGKCEEVY